MKTDISLCFIRRCKEILEVQNSQSTQDVQAEEVAVPNVQVANPATAESEVESAIRQSDENQNPNRVLTALPTNFNPSTADLPATYSATSSSAQESTSRTQQNLTPGEVYNNSISPFQNAAVPTSRSAVVTPGRRRLSLPDVNNNFKRISPTSAKTASKKARVDQVSTFSR